MSPNAFEIDPARPHHEQALMHLFEEADCPCYCRYWHFTGDKNEWQDRCANASDVSRTELTEALANEGLEAHGLVATFAGAEGTAAAAGWLKVAPREVMTKAYEQKLYRALPCFEEHREGVFLVGCGLVHPRARRAGLATAMLHRAIDLAPSWGATALEGLPRRPTEPVSDGELWTIPFRAYEENGFQIVHDFAPYPVMRLEVPRHA